MLIRRRILSGGRAGVLARAVAIATAVGVLASCSSSPSGPATKFSEAAYGVKASPKVASGSRIPKGGGTAMVGKQRSRAAAPTAMRGAVADPHGQSIATQTTSRGHRFIA